MTNQRMLATESTALRILRHAGEHCGDRGDYMASEILYALWLKVAREPDPEGMTLARLLNQLRAQGARA